MPQHQITLPTKKGMITFEVSRPTILAKRVYYRESQSIVGLSVRMQTLNAEYASLVDKIQAALGGDPQADVKPMLDRVDEIGPALADLNDKLFEHSNRRAYAILVPFHQDVAFEDVRWDQVDDSLLDEASDFFGRQQKSSSANANEPEPITTES